MEVFVCFFVFFYCYFHIVKRSAQEGFQNPARRTSLPSPPELGSQGPTCMSHASAERCNQMKEPGTSTCLFSGSLEMGVDAHLSLIILSISLSAEQCLMVIMRPHVQISSLSKVICSTVTAKTSARQQEGSQTTLDLTSPLCARFLLGTIRKFFQCLIILALIS